jgi:spermidine synthase
MGFFYTVKKSLVRKRTPFQQIELVDTDEFGKALLLDGITQVVEKNDYLYHEPMVHPAFCAHGNPREVLVIGGGDGGIIREAVKYPCIDTVRCAELDAEVIDFSKKYLHVVHGGCFDDPRVQLFIADGRSFIKQCRNSFDAIIMDMTDPFGPSRMLYTRDFFKSAKRALRDPRGVFVMHSESPICRPAAFNCIQRTLRSVFSHVRVLYVYIEMYATLWSISVASDRTDIGNIAPAVIDRRLARWGIGGLKVYNGTTNAAMQVAYPYIQETLAKKTRVITDRRPDFPDNFIAA